MNSKQQQKYPSLIRIIACAMMIMMLMMMWNFEIRGIHYQKSLNERELSNSHGSADAAVFLGFEFMLIRASMHVLSRR